MLNFVLSTIAFSLAIYGFDRYFKARSLTKTDKHKFLVFVLATLISIGVGYLVDIVDGDFYAALKVAKKLISYEEELLDHATKLG